MGNIKFANYQTKYQPTLPCILNNFQLKVDAGEKVGIVGRTGAGKSSLFLAMLRIIEPTDGAIVIDSRNIYHVGLQDLRSRISIIPQVRGFLSFSWFYLST